jgi:hypothetical protein
VLAGTTVDRTFTITNNGSANLTFTIDAASVTGAGFSLLSGPASSNLAPGASTTFVVRFEPVAPGAATGSVSFVSNDGDENPFNFSLAGRQNQLPAATITAPATYQFGQVIPFSATATDPEDGTLPASAFSWQIDFGHGSHFHEGIFNATGLTSDSFLFNFDERDADQFYRIRLTVTDSSGESFTTFRDVLPQVVQLTLATFPVGLDLSIDTTTSPGPFTVDSVVGMPRSLLAAATQMRNGLTYQFVSWSDSGAAGHDITTPASDMTYTATYYTPPSSRIGVVLGGAFTLDGSGNGRFDRGDWQFPGLDGQLGKPLVGDWNGDDIDEVGIFRGDKGRWTLDLNGNGVFDGAPTDARYVRLDGRAGGIPLVGDWDGDGDDDIGLFRPSPRTFTLYVDGVLFQTITGLGKGKTGNQPLVGDWDGDSAAEVGLYRGVTGVFTLDHLGDQSDIRTYTSLDGRPGGKAVVGDWDGDGSDSLGLFRALSGRWTLDVNEDGVFDGGITDRQFILLGGSVPGMPLVGDWDGDGDDEAGVFHGTRVSPWRLDVNGNGIFDPAEGDLRFGKLRGKAGGIPLVGRWDLGPVP